jgi:hypothetical protein
MDIIPAVSSLPAYFTASHCMLFIWFGVISRFSSLALKIVFECLSSLALQYY